MSEQSSPKKSNKLPLIIGGVVGGIIVLGLVCCGGPMMLMGLIGLGSKKQQEQQQQQVQEQKAIEVSASNLLSEYKNNETRANDQYKGKVVQITGSIHRIVERAVELKGGDAIVMDRVNCQFEDADRKTLSSLSSGNQVTIKGICDGKGFINVNIKKCKLVQ
jgi:hypothetical protein